MGCVALRLEAPGLTTLDLSSGAVAATTLDLGFPVVRAEALDAPGADGSIDTTTLSGPRSVALEVRVNEHLTASDRWTVVQQLKAFLNPRLRPKMYVQYPGGVELVVTLRAAGFQDSWTPQTVRTKRSTVFAQWVAPSGILESAELTSVAVGASLGSSALGRAYDLTFDRTYPASAAEGEVEVTNSGDRDAFPLIQLHGPWSGLTNVENATTGQALVFDGENVLVDNYIEIDTRAKTITLNGLSSQSRYHRLVMASSDWWTLVPGVNVLRFEPTTFTSPARMVVTYRHAYS